MLACPFLLFYFFFIFRYVAMIGTTFHYLESTMHINYESVLIINMSIVDKLKFLGIFMSYVIMHVYLFILREIMHV